MAKLAADSWHDNFIATATKEGRLRAKTIDTYFNNLKSLRLKLFNGLPSSWIFLTGDEGAAVLMLTTLRGDIGTSTLKAYVTALKGVYNTMAPAELRAKAGAQKAAWDEAERALRDRADAAMDAHKATSKQVKGYVPWPDIVACREGLPLASKGSENNSSAPRSDLYLPCTPSCRRFGSTMRMSRSCGWTRARWRRRRAGSLTQAPT